MVLKLASVSEVEVIWATATLVLLVEGVWSTEEDIADKDVEMLRVVLVMSFPITLAYWCLAANVSVTNCKGCTLVESNLLNPVKILIETETNTS